MNLFERVSPHHFFIIAEISAFFTIILPLPWPFRLILLVLYMSANAVLAGSLFFPKESHSWQFHYGIIITIASMMIGGSALFYLYRLTWLPITLLALIIPTIFFFVRPRPDHTVHPSSETHVQTSIPHNIISLLSLLVIIAGFVTVFFARTAIAIRSPWDTVPSYFFAIIFVAALALLTLAQTKKFHASTLALIALFFLLIVTVAAITYRVGFGFDSFIHQATEATIFRTGTISPKPFYYIGQYALVTFFAFFLGGFTRQIDTALLPLLVTLLIPTAYWGLKKYFPDDTRSALLGACAVALVPFSTFIVTTPQGLANLFAVLTFFLLFGRAPRPLLILLALTTLAIHPLTGIPTIFIVLLFLLHHHQPTSRIEKISAQILVGEITVAGSVALPFLFMLNAALSTTAVRLNTTILHTPDTVRLITRRFFVALDTAYFWKSISFLVILLIAGLALRTLSKKYPELRIFFFGAIILFGNYIVLKFFLQFPFLISYEQTNYADRLRDIALLLATPPFLWSIAWLYKKMHAATPQLVLPTSILIAVLITCTVYISYPRRDQYDTSRGWSTTAADVSATQAINQNAGSRTYIVLANQQVSAAAVREFGFLHYLKPTDSPSTKPIFYYPIPTGDRLYQYFLDMNTTRGDVNTAKQAMAFAGVNTAYFVVDNYWFDARQIIANAQKNADKNWNINNEVFIFKYQLR